MHVSCRSVFARILLSFAPALLLVCGAAQAANVTYRCTLKDVMVFSNRVHCQCKTATTDGTATIRFFAVPTSDVKLADRLLSVGTTALVSNRVFIATYSAGDTSGNNFGCGPTDCRKLVWFGIE